MIPAPRTWEEVPGAMRRALEEPFRKSAEGLPIVNTVGDVMGWRAGDLNANWGGPRPLTNMLIGSALGSLGGYGVGRLAEQFLPKKYFEPDAIRKRTMLMGAAMGAAPAAWQAFDNMRTTGNASSVLDTWPAKAADFWGRDGRGSEIFEPTIPRDQFNAAVWSDPYTHPRLQAATVGIVDAASITRGGSDFISPFDVARIAVGAGVGYASGLIAGKALGYLAGLTPEAQQKVQDIGMWSGILQATIPRVLGFR